MRASRPSQLAIAVRNVPGTTTGACVGTSWVRRRPDDAGACPARAHRARHHRRPLRLRHECFGAKFRRRPRCPALVGQMATTTTGCAARSCHPVSGATPRPGRRHSAQERNAKSRAKHSTLLLRNNQLNLARGELITTYILTEWGTRPTRYVRRYRHGRQRLLDTGEMVAPRGVLDRVTS